MGGTGRSPEGISFRDQLTLVVISDISKYFSVVNMSASCSYFQCNGNKDFPQESQFPSFS